MKESFKGKNFYRNDPFGQEVSMRGKMLLTIMLQFVKQGLLLLPPYCYLLFLDEIITERNFEKLWWIMGLYVAVYLLKSFVSVLDKMVYNRIYPAMQKDLKEKVLEKYGKLDMEAIQGYTAGELKERLHKDTENVVLYRKGRLDIGISVIHILIITGILFYLNWILAVVSLLLLPLSFLMTRYVKTRSNVEYGRKRELQGIYNDFMIHTMYFWKEMKANRLEEVQESQFESHWNGMGNAFLKAHMCWFLNRTFLAFKDVFLTKMGLYLFGGLLVVNHMGTVPVLLSFMEYYHDFTDRILEVSDIWMKRGEQEESLKRVESILRMQCPERLYKIRHFERLEIRHMDFRYPEGQKHILQDFNLEIGKGESIALTGESGCGKSTLIKLMAGYLTPDSGDILWNGHPMEQVDREEIYRTAGFLMQETCLFNLTIRENLLMGKCDASETEMADACAKANIMEFIRGLPEGLDTLIGENGIRLSGGQRQRLQIARLLLKNPEFIVFDEATSGLDYQNESEILELLLQNMGNRTFLMVTHRGTSAARCGRTISYL